MRDFLRRVLFGSRELPPLHPDYPWEQGGKLPTEKEIILFTEPRDADGYIDYETALNNHLRRDIKPEDNAMVLLLQAFGPPPEDSPSYFEWLGMSPPPWNVNCIIPLEEHFSFRRPEDVEQELQRILCRPWVSAKHPDFANWLTRNERSLALIEEASRRPAYYHPLTAKKGERGLMFGPFFSTIVHFRQPALLFCARANLRAGRGDHAGAWSDVFAALRLGRLVSSGGTWMEVILGLAIEHIAAATLLGLIEWTDMTANELRTHREAYAQLPPMGDLESKTQNERVFGLDLIQAIHRHGVPVLKKLEQPGTNDPGSDESGALLRDAVDWRMVAANVHTHYDRVMDIHRRSTHAERKAGWNEYAQQLKASAAEGRRMSLSRWALTRLKTAEARQTITRRLIYRLNSTADIWVVQLYEGWFRWKQLRENLLLAFALAEHLAEKGEYPNELTQLSPTYIDPVPNGVYSERPLVYKKADAGYLFYTSGPSGIESGGRLNSDNPPGDDIGVRMPSNRVK